MSLVRNQVKITGFLFYDNDEWFLSTNEDKKYHLDVENTKGVNESDLWELFGIRVVIWGFINGNGVIQVHTIMGFG
jgi:hypothetical protein